MYATAAIKAGPRKGKSLLYQGTVSWDSTLAAAEIVPESKVRGLFSGPSGKRAPPIFFTRRRWDRQPGYGESSANFEKFKRAGEFFPRTPRDFGLTRKRVSAERSALRRLAGGPRRSATLSR